MSFSPNQRVVKKNKKENVPSNCVQALKLTSNDLSHFQLNITDIDVERANKRKKNEKESKIDADKE